MREYIAARYNGGFNPVFSADVYAEMLVHRPSALMGRSHVQRGR
jgi:hypothetical protein